MVVTRTTMQKKSAKTAKTPDSYKRKIVKIGPVAGDAKAKRVILECGHAITTRANLRFAGGEMLCHYCKNHGKYGGKE